MGEDPDVIRQEIEATRERMGDTVDALGHKADVKSRAQESVSEKVNVVKDKVSGLTGRASDTASGVTGRASDATPSTGDVKEGARRAKGIAQENPLGLAVGSLAVGFLAGLLIPTTRVEDERLGPVAEQFRERVKDTGQEALERGKQVAQDAAQTARESGQQQAQELQGSAQQRAQGLREEAGQG
jgi:hypothetical protein